MTQDGPIEHFNNETGAIWVERVARTYPTCGWHNPVQEKDWEYTMSIRIMRQLMGGRMYPLTLEGLDRAMRELVRSGFPVIAPRQRAAVVLSGPKSNPALLATLFFPPPSQSVCGAADLRRLIAT